MNRFWPPTMLEIALVLLLLWVVSQIAFLLINAHTGEMHWKLFFVSQIAFGLPFIEIARESDWFNEKE